MKEKSKKARVYHAHLFGLRSLKYATLNKESVETTELKEISPKSPYYLFIPRDYELEVEYERGWKITEIMPVNNVGIVTARDKFALDFKIKELKDRISDFINENRSDSDVRSKYLSSRDKLNVHDARIAIRNSDRIETNFVECLYRPFDVRFLFYHDAIIERSRKETMRHMIQDVNLGVITVRQVAEGIFNHSYITNSIVESRITLSNKGIAYIFPLYLYPESSEETIVLETKRKPNLSPEFVKEFLDAISAKEMVNSPKVGERSKPSDSDFVGATSLVKGGKPGEVPFNKGDVAQRQGIESPLIREMSEGQRVNNKLSDSDFVGATSLVKGGKPGEVPLNKGDVAQQQGIESPLIREMSEGQRVNNEPSDSDFVGATSLVKGGTDENTTLVPFNKGDVAERQEIESPLIREMSEGQRVNNKPSDSDFVGATSLVKGGTNWQDNPELIERAKEHGFFYTGRYLPYDPKLKQYARELRKNMTKAERKLWYDFLKKLPQRFIRQHPIDHYIVDFYCPEVKLVIEVDGDTHFTEMGKEYDEERTYILEKYGLKIIRCINVDVLDNFDGVCSDIEEILRLEQVRATSLVKGGTGENTAPVPPNKGDVAQRQGVNINNKGETEQSEEGIESPLIREMSEGQRVNNEPSDSDFVGATSLVKGGKPGEVPLNKGDVAQRQGIESPLIREMSEGQRVNNKPSDSDFVGATSLVKGGKPGEVPPNKGDVAQRQGIESPLIREMSEGQRVNISEGQRVIYPEDIFYYIYAVLHSPTYRERYAEFLKIDFPRIPLPSDYEHYDKLADFGKELVEYHLMKKKSWGNITQHGEAEDTTVGKVQYDDNKQEIILDVKKKLKEQVRIGKVPKDIWEFHIGGYQVLHKWLKDRKGRKILLDDYIPIINALIETDRIMKVIDPVFMDMLNIG